MQNLILFLLLFTHIYFTIKLGFIQKWIPRGIRLSFHKAPGAKVSPYAALATALAATIGTGNIIGVSTAIALGGPGAVFWCWITGFFGVATCYGECFLSMLYRTKTPQGEYLGGPMYVMQAAFYKRRHLHGRSHAHAPRPLSAVLFSAAAVLASLGVGSSVQSHSIGTALSRHLQTSPSVIGMVTAILAGFVMLGGVKQISKICTFLVPFMSIFYIAGCAWLLAMNRDFLLPGLKWILTDACSGRAVTGGLLGGGFLTAVRIGVSRGLFTNEAGLGSIPMAASVSDCTSPATQSLVSMTGPFWDTVVICAVTGLVIVSSILKCPALYQGIAPDELCFAAFSQLPFWGEEILSIALILFSFATILGWCYYGECGIRFLFGERAKKPYQILYLLFVYLGAVISLELVWNASDLLNACMVLPNLLCLWLLRKKIVRPSKGEGKNKRCL